MCQEVVLADEALRARVTHVGCALLVTIHVTAKVILVAELLRAYRALKRLVLHVVALDVLGEVFL